MEEKISVIIPVYNVVNCIRESTNSIINQTYHNNQKNLIVNDGLIDGCSFILDEFVDKDSRFKVIRKANREQGFDETKQSL